MELPAYDLLVPPRVVFGDGRRRELGAVAATLGRRAFVFWGSRTLERSGRLDELIGLLEGAGLRVTRVGGVHDEPEVAAVDEAVRAIRAHRDPDGAGRDLVVAIGGGSAIDLAKAAAALAAQDVDVSCLEYLEGVGTGRRLSRDPLPLLAMPTTAGAGAEATKNAVISCYDPPLKKSLRDDRMVPRAVLIDPELGHGVSRVTTAGSGMDAITQLVESYISGRARPVPQALARHGLEVVFRRGRPAVLVAYEDPGDASARAAMAHAAFLSGVALANSGLGFAHGVAPALGVLHRAPHGLACAVMLPAALRVNRHVREREIAELAPVITSRSFTRDRDAVDAVIESIESLSAALEIPSRLGSLGVTREGIPALVAASRGSSMSANPRDVPDEEMTAIFEAML